jgi:hypothetical protein
VFYSVQLSEDGEEYLLFAHFHEEYERGEVELPSYVIATVNIEHEEMFKKALESRVTPHPKA